MRGLRPCFILVWGLAAMLAGEARGSSRIVITAPHTGARPRSAYLAIEGTGPPLNGIELLENGATLRTTPTAADGHFDCVLKLPPGEHELRARVVDDHGDSAHSIDVTIADGFAPPTSGAAWFGLREGDVLFSRGDRSEQVQSYNPLYTHTALYVGPDADGTPMVLEPMLQSDETEGVVGLVPLEQTVIWRESRAAIYRLRAGFKPGERQALLAWARTTAAREIPFWSMTDDFGSLFRAWLLWDREHDRPLDRAAFNRLLASMHARTLATDRFNCVTLVWRAFLEATGGRVDLSRPNRALESAGAHVAPRFLAAIQPALLLPDTLALSGKLELVVP